MNAPGPWPVKVSVLMITYNHERYIAQAIESVLMQKTSFPCELVIGEDCSTDGTRRIVVPYQQNHPDRVRVLLHERNLGSKANLDATLRACRGQYVAVLEGDDYWTCPQKLQIQADFLDEHPDYSICFHKVEVVDERSGAGSVAAANMIWPSNVKPTTSIKDLAAGYYMPTGSLMFRNVLTDGLPGWIYQAQWSDWPLCLAIAEHGLIGFLDRVMGVRRLADCGVYASLPLVERLERGILQYRTVNAGLGYRYAPALEAGVFRLQYRLALEYRRMSNRAKASEYLRRCLLARPLPRFWKAKVKLFCLLECPAVWRWLEAFRGRNRSSVPALPRKG
jgi:glycosyltransferase involved in cell wall biosynthesis